MMAYLYRGHLLRFAKRLDLNTKCRKKIHLRVFPDSVKLESGTDRQTTFVVVVDRTPRSRNRSANQMSRPYARRGAAGSECVTNENVTQCHVPRTT